MQSGKSTTANILIEKYGYEVVKFAEPLKRMLASLYPYMGKGFDEIDDMIEGGAKEEPIEGFGALTPRRMMQTLGTEWGRNTLQDDFWVRIAIRRIAALTMKGHKVVVDDLRFPNELAALASIPGRVETWHIHRPHLLVKPTHASEGQLEKAVFDRHIYNLGSQKDLETQIQTLMESLRGN